MRECPVCKAEYAPRTSRQIACSPKCNSIRQNTKKRTDFSRKRCRTCREELPVESFERAHRSCLTCEDLAADGLKRCTKCREVKPVDEFHVRPDRKSGRSAQCRACKSDESRIRNSSPEKQMRQRELHLVSRFRLSLDEYEAMLLAQGGACAICGDPPDEGKHLHVDHCHAIGKVRKLLCFRCNTLLGNARDDIAILQRAIAYLETHAWANTDGLATIVPTTTTTLERS